MTEDDKDKLGKTLWAIANDLLRGFMDADDFRDYMLAFLFLRYLSDSYQESAAKEIDGKGLSRKTRHPHPLQQFYQANEPTELHAI